VLIGIADEEEEALLFVATLLLFPFETDDGIFIFCEVVFAACLRDVNPLDAECFAFSLISFILSPTEKTFLMIDGDGDLCCCCCCCKRCWSSICLIYVLLVSLSLSSRSCGLV